MSRYKYNGLLEIDGEEKTVAIDYTMDSDEYGDSVEIEEVDVDGECVLEQSTLKDEAMDQLFESMVRNAKEHNWEDFTSGA